MIYVRKITERVAAGAVNLCKTVKRANPKSAYSFIIIKIKERKVYKYSIIDLVIRMIFSNSIGYVVDWIAEFLLQ